VKHLHDDFEQPVVGDEIVRNDAGAAKVIRGDGLGIADHAHIQDPYTALDQHGPQPSRFAGISLETGTSSISAEDFFAVAQKPKAHRLKNQPMRLSEGTSGEVLSDRPAGLLEIAGLAANSR
jgi:hypothetical protein